MAGLYTQNRAGLDPRALQEFAPAPGDAMSAAVRSAWEESPGPTLWNWAEAQPRSGRIPGPGPARYDPKRAERRLSKEEADARIAAAGVSLSVGDGQHSERSLQVLIERRREMESIEDVRARTPWDWGSPVRAAAMLGTGILDPINLASAFFPAAEALQAMRLTGAANALRAVETLGSGSPSLLTRAGARAVTGAAEGVAGTVALEPLYAFARRDMGDDYGMVDSITNIAFGGLFGGGLHMGIGAAGDAVRALRGQTRAAPGPAPEPTMLDKMRIATETQSREMIGESMRRESPAHIEEMLAEAGTAPPKRASTPEEVMRAADEIRREMASRAPMTEERAALRELEAERGGLDAMLDTRDPEVRAENEQRISLLDEEIAQRRADLETREVVEAAARGETTAQFDAMVQERVAANRSREALLDAIDAAPEGSARWRAQQASPETREAAGRTAVAQMVDGRSPDVDAIMGLETGASTMDDVRAAADRQRSADSLRTADVKGSEDAAVMAQEAKKPQNLQEAEAELQRALDELAEIEKAGADAFRYARAYHGTPHRFDKFSTAKIGSGEGAQSYGWGLYFASRKEVAEHYRDGLAEATATVDGKPIEPLNPLHIAARQLAESKGDRAAAIKALDDVAAVAKRYLDDDFETIDEAASLLDSDASIPDYAPGVGQLYEVEVPDDGELLLWDRPLGEQPDGVRKALRNQYSDDYLKLFEGKTGGYFYKAIAGGEQTEDLRKQASRELSSIGIKGIKYLDGGSRDNGEGTHNYVIFDDRAVEIANRQSEVAASFRKSEAILEAIRESWGEDTDALIKASRIQVVETADDLPGVHPANVQAVAMPDGTTFVVAQNVKPEQIRGLILHEVGVHHGMPAILGPERWAKLLADFEAMVLDAPDDAPIWAAWRKATQDTADLGLSPVQRQERVREEALAYLVQDAPESTLVQRIIAAVKRWINALIGDRLKLTDADLREMAIASLRGFKRREAGSVAPADETGGRYARGGKPSDELKPFDQAIERAKRYAEVLRMLATDGEEATRAAARDLTSDEITDLLKQLYTWNRRKRDSLRKAREGIQAEDRANAFQDEALKAADGLANNILMDATIAKRNAALNLAGRLRAASFIRQFGADAKSLSEGAKSLVAGGQRRLQGARSSAAAEQKQFRGEWVGGLIHDMEEAGLWELFVSDSLSRDVANAMWRIGRDKPLDGVAPEVKAMAEIVFRYQEAARGTKNRFGAWVRDLQGYIVRQSHDMWRIRDAGYEAWRDVVLPRLDIERTMRDVPEVAERSLDAVLREVYDGFASGLHLKYLSIDDVPPSVGPASLAKQVSASREIYFRDADAWFEYNEQFGVGSLSYAVLNGLDRSGHAAGLLKTLGTNPEGNLAAVLDHIEEGIVDPAERRAFHDNRASVLALLKHVTGEANIPANAIWAKRASNVRALQSMAKLGGAVVSSVTDIPVYASEIRFQGGNLFSGMAEAIGGLLRGRGSKEQKAILAEIGLFQESMVGDVMARFDADDLLGGLMSRGMQQFFKWNGLTWWTETLRSSIGLSTAHRMALATALPWEQLDPNLSSVLSLYNIDAGKWAVLRQAATKEADGMAFLTPEGMNAVPRSSLETYIQSVGRQANEAAVQNLRADLQAALRNMYIDRATHAVIEPDARTRWALLRDTQKGTLWGETARFVAQFKSFPTALLQRVYGREIQGRGYNSLTDMMRRGKGDMLGLIHLMLWMTLFGYGAMTAKDLLRGRKPRSLVDEDGRPVVSTMMSAMLQGGAMGIYGDLILGETNRVGGGLLQTLAGPSLGLAEDAFDLKNRIVAGRDFGPAALRLAVNNTPFANLFYVRPALDYLILYRWQEAMNPGYLRRLERDVEQKNRQEFLFRPSEVVQ